MAKYRFVCESKAHGANVMGRTYTDEHELSGMAEAQSEIIKIVHGGYVHHNTSGALTVIPTGNIDNIYVCEVPNG